MHLYVAKRKRTGYRENELPLHLSIATNLLRLIARIVNCVMFVRASERVISIQKTIEMYSVADRCYMFCSISFVCNMHFESIKYG